MTVRQTLAAAVTAGLATELTILAACVWTTRRRLSQPRGDR